MTRRMQTIRGFTTVFAIVAVAIMTFLLSSTSLGIFKSLSRLLMAVPGPKPLPSLEDITLEEIGLGLDQNRFTVVDLVRAYLARIEEVNHVFNAVLEVNPDAITIGRELDEERRSHGRRGPLHGVPVLVKDNIFSMDRMTTSAGSYALVGAQPAREATVIQRLKKAGAIILGKANLSEWANFRSTNATNGWSARGGQTYGAFVPNQESQGSSSGPAVATILGLTAVSLGTETDGSIVLPSMKNNVVGFRTTTGLVPRDGVIPLSDRQDTVGPMARTVKDAASVLSIIAGPSEFDNATRSIPFTDVPDYVQYCKGVDLTGIRLGVPRDVISSADVRILASFDKALQTLSESGATIVDNVAFRSQKEWDAWSSRERRRPLDAEFKASISRWCANLVTNPNHIRSVDDIIEFIKSHPEEAYPERNVDRLIGAQESSGVDAPVTQQALKKMLRCCADEGILAALNDYQLDALVFPNGYSLPSTFAARAGMPVFAVPLGFYPEGTPVEKTARGDQVDVAPNIPFGIAFAAEPYSEAKLVQVAYAFEQLWPVRTQVRPYKIPKTQLGHIVDRRTRLESL